MNDTDADGVRPEFRARTDPAGLRVVDPIEGVQFDLLTPTAVDPEPVQTDGFCFPVDAAVNLDVDEVVLPWLTDAFVRRRDGDLVGQASTMGSRSFPPDGYNVELTGLGVKLYVAVDGAVTVDRRDDEVAVSVPEPGLAVGARSFHERPAGTVTTTEGVRDAMRAVSLLGSALKTTSPERSFPTLRGHPPLIAVGEKFAVPEGIERPETGVRIEVPGTYEHVFVASQLAYYLGAEVVPGDEPRLVAAGAERSLAGPDGYETAIARVLKGTFLLDCLARTAGHYQVALHERAAVEPSLDIDLDDLYHRPLDERVAAYLEVPYETLAPHVPTWKLTADVYPAPAHVEMLPYVAADLGVVRCPRRPERTTIRREPAELTAFFRDGEVDTRGAADGSDAVEVVRPAPADSLEQAWVGEGLPVTATKSTASAHRRRLATSRDDPGTISVAVVCNDPAMADEAAVADAFGDREFVAFDVSLHQGLTTAGMRDLLRSDLDFLHYVGHVDGAGIRCVDGVLDARTVDDVGVTAFLLNACRSQHQGAALVEAGSVGGIVTLTEVDDRAALTMGRTLVRLLELGYPLSAALSVARDRSHAGTQYVVIGAGGVELAKSAGGMPKLAEVETRDDGGYDLSLVEYPTAVYGLGSLGSPNVEESDEQYLSGGTIGPFAVDRSRLEEVFALQAMPVVLDGELRWSEEVAAEDDW